MAYCTTISIGKWAWRAYRGRNRRLAAQESGCDKRLRRAGQCPWCLRVCMKTRLGRRAARFRPRGQLGPTQRAWPAAPKPPREAADRWELLGHGRGIASTSVFLRLLRIFQAKVCCWFLSPLVPTYPGTCLKPQYVVHAA